MRRISIASRAPHSGTRDHDGETLSGAPFTRVRCLVGVQGMIQYVGGDETNGFDAHRDISGLVWVSGYVDGAEYANYLDASDRLSCSDEECTALPWSGRP